MEVFFWFLAIVIGIGLFFRYFGRRIFIWFLNQLAKRAMRHMQNQSQQYQQQNAESPYEEKIRTGEGTEVRIPKGYEEQRKKAKKPNLSAAEEVDYEEL